LPLRLGRPPSSPKIRTLPTPNRRRGIYDTLKNITNPFTNPLGPMTQVLLKTGFSQGTRQSPSSTKSGIPAHPQISRTFFGLPRQRTIGPTPQVSLVVDILQRRVLDNGDTHYGVKYQGLKKPSWVSEKRLTNNDFRKSIEHREKWEIEDTRTYASQQLRQGYDSEGRPIGQGLYMKASKQEFKDVNAPDHSEG
jgi:hypothetical protein